MEDIKMELTLKDLLKEEIEYFTRPQLALEMVNYYNQDILKNDRNVVTNTNKDIVKLLNNDLEWYLILFEGNEDYSSAEEYVMLFTTENGNHEVKSFDEPIKAIEDLDKFIDYVIDHEEDFEYWINFDGVRSQLEDEEEEEEE
jgi:hypothetical protein